MKCRRHFVWNIWISCFSLSETCNLITWHRAANNCHLFLIFNPLTPNDPNSGRTAPLNSKCCILYIYSTNISTEYFKHGIYSPFFPLQNAVCFINLTYLFPVLFTFYIQSVLKLKNNSSDKSLRELEGLFMIGWEVSHEHIRDLWLLETNSNFPTNSGPRIS